jgi:transitional endoplasmic reticulum ATPase
MWVGESERGVREIFRKARQAAPCVIFFDELDALAPPRGGGGGDGAASERVVGQLLTELDGIEAIRGVVVLAATNRPDRIDPALLRPGRFDYVLELPPPDEQGRAAILRIHTRTMPLAPDVDLGWLAHATAGMVGADLDGLCRRAALLAIGDHLEQAGAGVAAPDALRVSRRHFALVLQELASKTIK